MKKTVLVALDYSKTDESLIQRAMEWAKGEGLSIVLLHVFSYFDPLPDSESLPQEPDENALETVVYQFPEGGWESWVRLETKSFRKLQIYVKQLLEAGLSVTSKHILGQPASIICDLARELNVDTILIGRSGRAGIAEAVLGSISNYVIHHAPCSIWIIRNP